MNFQKFKSKELFIIKVVLVLNILVSSANAQSCPDVTSGKEWGNGSSDPAIYSGCQADYVSNTNYYELQSYQSSNTINVWTFSNSTDPTPNATTNTVDLGTYSDRTVVKGTCGTTYPTSGTSYSQPFESNTTYCGYVKTNNYILTIQGTTQSTKDQLFINPSAKYYSLNSGGGSSGSSSGVNDDKSSSSINVSSGSSTDSSTGDYNQKELPITSGGTITTKEYTGASPDNKLEVNIKDDNNNTKATVSSELNTDTTISNDGDVTVSSQVTKDSTTTTITVNTSSTSAIISSHQVSKNSETSKASSKLNNTTTKISSNGNVETSVKYNSSDLSVVTDIDGKSVHTVTVSGNTLTKVTSSVSGAQTVIDTDGSVNTQVSPNIYTDPSGCTINAQAFTDAKGETETIFKKICSGIESLLDSTLQDNSKFEIGNSVEIYEKSGDMYMEINATVNKEIVF